MPNDTKKLTVSRGVTIVEIAIVLVVLALLLGGILKGQELINHTKVLSPVEQQSSVTAAWFNFTNRYQAMLGDFINAQKEIVGAGSPIDNTHGKTGGGLISARESPIVFQNLAGSGYLSCLQCTATGDALPFASNSLQNIYGGVTSIWSDFDYYATIGGPDDRGKLQIHTGPWIPSNVISEMDIRLDDGIASTGNIVMNEYDPTTSSYLLNDTSGLGPSLCTSSSSTSHQEGSLTSNSRLYWRPANASPPVEGNCGGAILL